MGQVFPKWNGCIWYLPGNDLLFDWNLPGPGIWYVTGSYLVKRGVPTPMALTYL